MFPCQKCRTLQIIFLHSPVLRGKQYRPVSQLFPSSSTTRRYHGANPVFINQSSTHGLLQRNNQLLLKHEPLAQNSLFFQRKLYVSNDSYATGNPEAHLHEHEEDYLSHLAQEDLEHDCDIPFETSVPPSTKGMSKSRKGKGGSKGKKAKTVSETLAETSKTVEVGKKIQGDPGSRSRDLAVERSLRSFLHMCVHQGMFDRAVVILKHYHAKAYLPNSSSIYDILLKGAAKQARWKVFLEIMDLMKERKVTPSLYSYAAGFECLGRSRSSRGAVLGQTLLEEMQGYKFKPNDIFEFCRFGNNEMQFVVKGIRMANPDFVPKRSAPQLSYTCELTRALNNLESDPVTSPAAGVMTSPALQQLASQQLKTELNGVVEIESVSKSAGQNEEQSRLNIEKLDKLEDRWRNVVMESFERNLRIAKSQFYTSNQSKKTIQLYPYLLSLPKEEFVQLVMQDIKTLASGSETFSPSLFVLCRQLGVRVMQRFELISKQESGMLEKIRKVYTEYCDWYASAQEGEILNPRQKWQQLLSQHIDGPDLDAEEVQWPYAVQSNIGHFLYDIILKDIKIGAEEDGQGGVEVPAFYVVYRNKGVKTIREVKPHPAVSELYAEASGRKLSFESLLVPMLSPPLPWTSYRTGGYLLSSVPLIRLPTTAHQQRVRVSSAPQQQLYPALDCLNALGSVPWRVNTRILDLVVEVFNSNGDKKLDVPQPPSECQMPAIDVAMNATDRAALYKERQAARRRKAEMYSIWCDTLYRLSLANHFRDKVFWLPHNMDFRGRVYPCPPHLTHLSSDLARSLLVFAQGKPLGPSGLNWLKIHAINLTGLKKRDPVAERLRFADEIMPEILDSADRPLTGNKWWVNSDEPWQTLAACMEIAAAVRSPNPEEYVCHLPIHQDGSCNGLQHYAALGRDQVGAASVNLAPAERPQDVYSSVAALVERERAKDAAAGLEIAKVLEGHIKRKVIKQTVMTTVYGVTQYGARLQIAKQLDDLSDFPAEHVWAGSMYLAGKTFQSLGEMFTSAKVIQDWFTECARLISTVCCQNVEWVTPLGLPVVQPYSKAQIKRADSEESYFCDSFQKPNVMKQRNAFPPNFIHSLDSSHMMLTSLFSQRAGITFASIHDCFWTHACTVDLMNKICRQQFVALHSEPILENLSRSMINQYAYKPTDFTNDGSVQDMTKFRLNRILGQVPRRGDFDLSQVLDSVYFFS